MINLPLTHSKYRREIKRAVEKIGQRFSFIGELIDLSPERKNELSHLSKLIQITFLHLSFQEIKRNFINRNRILHEDFLN